jgi:cell wall-associated NlpC family hydrolase
VSQLDPRVNAFRPDLADVALRIRVAAARYVTGEGRRVGSPVAPVHRAPDKTSRLETEALMGESVSVFETTPDGWAWVQLDDDRYVGWLPTATLSAPGPEPTHRVSALRTLVFAEPDIKSPVLHGLPCGAQVAAVGEAEDKNGRYRLIAPEGAVVSRHLAPLGAVEADWVAVAERFLNVPYLWGGKTSLGVDCSALVEIALRASGMAAPRDSDMQERALGSPLPIDGGLPPLARGDLVFWKGHVGIMRNSEELLHANAHHMAVVIELLAAASARIDRSAGPITSIRRIG